MHWRSPAEAAEMQTQLDLAHRSVGSQPAAKSSHVSGSYS